MKKLSQIAALIAALTLVGGTRASADLVQTDPNGLAFIASLTADTSGVYRIFNTGSVINGKSFVPPNPGFGSGVMWLAGPTVGGPEPYPNEVDTDLTDGVQSYAEYIVRFTNEGTYRLFLSGQRTASPQDPAEGRPVADNDSLWVGRLDVDHTNTDPLNWHNFALAAGGISYRDTTVDWVIDNSNVNTDLTLTLGMREDGPIFDRIAFVLDGSGITGATIASSLPLIIPEPATWALGATALGFVALLRRRRRLTSVRC